MGKSLVMKRDRITGNLVPLKEDMKFFRFEAGER